MDIERQLNRGQINIEQKSEEPQTQTFGQRSGIPPLPPTAVGSAESSREPEEITAGELVLALNSVDYNSQLMRDFEEIMNRYGVLDEGSRTGGSGKGLGEFMRRADKAGLIKKKRPLTIRQYIGALLPQD